MNPQSICRLQTLERHLRAGASTATAARLLQCSDRTVRRMIRVLRDAGGKYDSRPQITDNKTEYVWRLRKAVFSE